MASVPFAGVEPGLEIRMAIQRHQSAPLITATLLKFCGDPDMLFEKPIEATRIENKRGIGLPDPDLGVALDNSSIESSHRDRRMFTSDPSQSSSLWNEAAIV